MKTKILLVLFLFISIQSYAQQKYEKKGAYSEGLAKVYVTKKGWGFIVDNQRFYLNLTTMILNYYAVQEGGGISHDPVLRYAYTGLSTFHAYGVSTRS